MREEGHAYKGWMEGVAVSEVEWGLRVGSGVNYKVGSKCVLFQSSESPLIINLKDLCNYEGGRAYKPKLKVNWISQRSATVKHERETEGQRDRGTDKLICKESIEENEERGRRRGINIFKKVSQMCQIVGFIVTFNCHRKIFFEVLQLVFSLLLNNSNEGTHCILQVLKTFFYFNVKTQKK